MSVSESLQEFRQELSEFFKKQEESEESQLLNKLLQKLCEVIALHVQLIELEGLSLSKVSRQDYFLLLESYYRLFNKIKRLPRLGEKSSYEICLVADLDVILAAHLEEE
jgi:glutamine synthetase adenylyltransferase